MSRYEVTHAPHFIAGRLRAVGDVVTLPEGVKPGRHLVALPEPEPAIPPEPEPRRGHKHAV